MPKINEVFNSISGEVCKYHQGALTTFVRYSGCNAACHYCDTKHQEGKMISMEDLMDEIDLYYARTKRLCITGGEPLLQFNSVVDLVCRYKYSWVETNGLANFKPLIGMTSLVVDWKFDPPMMPGCKPSTTLLDYASLTENDFIKFVIGGNQEFREFIEIRSYLIAKGCKATLAVAPIHNLVEPKQLVSWLNHENINEVVLNVQLHKLIGLP